MNVNTIKNKVKFYSELAAAFLPQSLPQGGTEFKEWAESIEKLFDLPTKNSDEVKFMLGSMLMHLGPQEDRKSKYFFVKSIRSAAAKQVGAAAFSEVKQKQIEARMAAEAAAKSVEATTQDPKVVDIGKQK